MDAEQREAGRWMYEVCKLGTQTNVSGKTCLSKLEKSRETELNLTYSGLHVDGLYRANDEKRCHHY